MLKLQKAWPVEVQSKLVMSLENKKDASRKKPMMKELEWIRKSAKGQQKKSKARMKSFEKEQEQVTKSAHANLVESGSIVIPNGPRLGNKVIQVSNLNHSFDDGEKKIFSDVSFTVPNGATVGIIGGISCRVTSWREILTIILLLLIIGASRG